MFVDSDDTLFPNSVEILAQHSDCDFVMGSYEILNMENGEYKKIVVLNFGEKRMNFL